MTGPLTDANWHCPREWVRSECNMQPMCLYVIYVYWLPPRPFLPPLLLVLFAWQRLGGGGAFVYHDHGMTINENVEYVKASHFFPIYIISFFHYNRSGQALTPLNKL